MGLEVLWNEKGKGLKVKIPIAKTGKYFGQVAYGKENVAQRFVGVNFGNKSLIICSSGVYGNSKKGKNLYLNLFNGSAYCAHPIEDRPLLDGSRYNAYIEQGKHVYNFRICLCASADCEKVAQEYVNLPYSVNAYPHGNGDIKNGEISISGDGVVLSSLRKAASGKFIARIFNGTDKSRNCSVKIGDAKGMFALGKYSFKTLIYNGKKISESKRADLY